MSESQFVVAVFPDLGKVNETVKDLIDMGIDKKEISVVTKLEEPAEELIEDVEIKKADSHVRTWAELGAVAGGLLGLLIGGVVFTAPAVGTMVATGASLSGAINGLLGGAVAGGALFGVADGLIEWGMAAEEAKRLEKLVAEGKVLLIAKAPLDRVNEVEARMKKDAERVEILDAA
ncbi:hypothetical protein [Nitratifractor sp.]